jgi:hypothetical protein
MKITESRNGATNLTVNNDELGFIQALFTLPDVAKHGFMAELLNHSDVDAMAAELKDWLEYKRLDEKFRGRPEYESRAAGVKALLCKP